jgi:hypothetical protein
VGDEQAFQSIYVHSELEKQTANNDKNKNKSIYSTTKAKKLLGINSQIILLKQFRPHP